MKTDNIEDIFTLSPIQQGMLFHILADADSRMYYEQEVCRLRGEMDLSAFCYAWEELVKRHQMLRTSFAWKNLPHPLQIVCKEIELPFDYKDLRASDKEEQQTEIQTFLLTDAENAAKIGETPSLFNLQLFRTGESEYVFVLSIHHLIHDAWSFAVLLSEFIEIYTAKVKDREPQLNVSKNYKDYIVWLKRQDFGAGLEFWSTSLKNFTKPTKLSVGHKNFSAFREKNLAIETNDVFGKEEFFLPAETSAKINLKACRSRVTPNIFFQSLWAVFLASRSAEENIIFGVTVAGRPLEIDGVETIVGNFINTLPLGIALDQTEKLENLWSRLQKMQARASLCEHIPLTQIAAACGRKTGEEMFESILVYQNFSRELHDKTAANLHFESFRTFGHPNYPLTLRVTPNEGFFIELLYDERVIMPERVAEIADVLCGLCELITEEDELSVGDVLKRANAILREKRKSDALNKRFLFAEKLGSVKAVPAVAEKN